MSLDATKQVWLADWRAVKLPYCSLYVVCPDGSWPCKVGISVNAMRRLIALQTSVWKPLKVSKCYWTRSVAEARKLEKAVHQRLSGDNVWLHGEWFDMRPNAAAEMIEFVSLVEGIELYDKIDNQDVINSIEAMFQVAKTPDAVRARIDVDYVQGSRFEDLANVANQGIRDGIVVDPRVREMVMLYKEGENDKRLPSLRR